MSSSFFRFVDIALMPLRPLISLILKCLVNYRLVSPPPKNLRPPYLIISSHVSDLDVFLLMTHTLRFPMVVVHELLLRNGILNKLLSLFGPISKQSGLPDARALRQMKRAVAMGRCILLYPEGDEIWLGQNAKLDIKVAQLARFLDVPVLVFKQEGAFTSFPRWTSNIRRGRVDLTYKLAVEKADYKKLDDSRVLLKLSAAYDHDERQWLSTGPGKQVRFISPRPANGLERLLFLCPECKTHSCIRSDRAKLYCSVCGFEAHVDAKLRFKASPHGFSDIWDWHAWQETEWDSIIGDAFSCGTLHLEESPVKAQIINIFDLAECRASSKSAFPHKKWDSSIDLVAESIVIDNQGIFLFGEGGKVIWQINLRDILSARVINFYRPNWLLLRTEKEYIKIRLTQPGNPVYAWMLVLKKYFTIRDATAADA
jgi:1-acyl-sn-glycerol-3-phosphate acyltransferase